MIHSRSRKKSDSPELPKSTTWGSLIDSGTSKGTTWCTFIALAVLMFLGGLMTYEFSLRYAVQRDLESPAMATVPSSPAPETNASAQPSEKSDLLAVLRRFVGLERAEKPPVSTAQEIGLAASNYTEPSSPHTPPAEENDNDPVKAKLAPDLQGLDPNTLITTIVQFQEMPGSTHLSLVSEQGGQQKAQLPLVKSSLVTIRAGALTRISHQK